MYILKKSDGSRVLLGVSTGNRVEAPDGTFWITGWSATTRRELSLRGFYTLVFPDARATSVEVMEKGRDGADGLRFRLAS